VSHFFSTVVGERAEHFGRASKQHKVDRDATTAERETDEKNLTTPHQVLLDPLFDCPPSGKKRKKKTQKPLPPTQQTHERTMGHN
jgi:hypothetical protein